MLSICIPHYNFKNPNLLECLMQQCQSLAIKFELIVIDDASEPEKNQYLNQFKDSFYNIIFLEKNVGRSAIRNLLANKAKYPYLLFLDADAEIVNPKFIENYLQELKEDVICGGRVYSKNKPSNEFLIHWNYGIHIEEKSNTNFHSNNFMIKKEVFEKVKFNEELTKYGYEDVLFGLEVKKAGYNISNINNPVKHIDLKTNAQFLEDTRNSLHNLVYLLKNKTDSPLNQEVRIVKIYNKLKKFRISFLLNFGNKIISSTLRHKLVSAQLVNTNFYLTIYKLYYFHSIVSYK